MKIRRNGDRIEFYSEVPQDRCILNTNTGVLHAKECGDRSVEDGGITPGHKKHYSSYENAIKDPKHKKDHDSCLG